MTFAEICQFKSYGTQRRVHAADIARQTRARRVKPGQWLGHCPGPVHRNGDRHPSLSIREGWNGVVLLYCFSGCRTEDALEALGLGWSALFAGPPPEDWAREMKRFEEEERRRKEDERHKWALVTKLDRLAESLAAELCNLQEGDAHASPLARFFHQAMERKRELEAELQGCRR
jgi:hypothetical protein